jgi:hypothetical protein
MPSDSSFDRVYVGRMPRGMSELALREAFGAVGIGVRQVEVVLDRATGLSRGFAFVWLCETVHPDVDALPLARMRCASFDGRPFDVRVVPRRPRFAQ